jgi:excisionase family DNA binding protein
MDGKPARPAHRAPIDAPRTAKPASIRVAKRANTVEPKRPKAPAGSVQLPKLVVIGQVADHLGVSVRHVRRLVAERRIPYVKWGNLLRFDPREVSSWCAQPGLWLACGLVERVPCVHSLEQLRAVPLCLGLGPERPAAVPAVDRVPGDVGELDAVGPAPVLDRIHLHSL